jgi:hypothetical protein
MPTPVGQRALAESTTLRVRQLLIAGKRESEIMTRIGCSYNLVAAVRTKLSQEEKNNSRRHRANEAEIAAVAERCPTCGRKVLMPCLACAVGKH